MAAHHRPTDAGRQRTSCGRIPEDKETLIEDAGLDPFEKATLKIFMFFIQTFSCPASQSWMYAMDVARQACGDQGAGFAMKVFEAMKAVRTTRKSTFTFSSPTCPGCSEILTEHERRMLLALAAIRVGKIGVAQLELMMLCEGNDVGHVIEAFAAVADAMPVRECQEVMA